VGDMEGYQLWMEAGAEKSWAVQVAVQTALSVFVWTLQ
jgi:hypothetical protein